MRLTLSSNARRLGFTLIELIVVIVLIGIMTAMIIPEMQGTYEDALLRSTGRRLVDAFNLAYSQAVTVNQLHRVRLDRKSGRYFVERIAREGEGRSGFITVRDPPGGEGALDTRISIEIRRPDENPAKASDPEAPLVSEDDLRGLHAYRSATGPRPEAPLVSGDDLRVRDRGEAIAFYPDGTADPGEILLRDRDGFRLSLRINPTTARVRIVELGRE